MDPIKAIAEMDPIEAIAGGLFVAATIVFFIWVAYLAIKK